ncbi:hypothetical protein EOM39_03295 [Candidatus Gracilibacteria bacterium]|nr:hypothetical protein [Candidatus Gracilibacteria bacterium]
MFNTVATIKSLWLSKFEVLHEGSTSITGCYVDGYNHGLLIRSSIVGEPLKWMVIANNGDLYACSVDDEGPWSDYAS